ncbi:MAG: sulfotransferase [Rubrobacter sp.]|nr:sulfotransferase [Rubrobacter sp.]
MHSKWDPVNIAYPNFFVVGAAKAGTTSLYRYLGQHPEVYMSPLKEPNWFSRVHAPGRITSVASEAEYLRLFEGRGEEPAAGEASPSYLWDEKAPWRIKNAVPEAKIIAILRHPAERALSDYAMDVQYAGETLPLLEALKEGYYARPKTYGVTRMYVDLGFYSEQVGRYLEAFEKTRVRIFLYEDLERDPRALLRSVLEFLDVDPGYADSIETGVQYNKYSNPKGGPLGLVTENVLNSRTFRSPRFRALRARLIPDAKLRFRIRQSLRFKEGVKPEMDSESRRFLMDLYREDIRELQGLIGRDLEHWLQPEHKG